MKAIFQRAVDAGHAFQRFESAEAARAVGVATWPALPELFNKLYGEKAETPRIAPTSRLRLLGTLGEESVSLEPVQEEERARGSGAGLDSGITVVTLDGSGRELFVDAVRCLRRERPVLFTALPPISPAVKAVELRLGKKMLARVERVDATGDVEKAWLVEETRPQGKLDEHALVLHWRYRHSRNARPALSLLLGSEGYNTEVLRIDPCEPAQLHRSRYGSARKIELLASDGWNRSVRKVDGAVLENPDPVSIRRLADGRWFADLPSDERWLADPGAGKKIEITWSLNGQDLPDNDKTPRVLELPPGASGKLQLKVKRGDMPHPIVDERTVSEA
jgi:hypothetical protein